ncbi:uncharacterized protein [Diadema antillarum]|uniref:uncharacterized protein isoform X2 n=1 Tax=Diadema antillarum TaxID=105358 RepID=UPI003A8365F6
MTVLDCMSVLLAVLLVTLIIYVSDAQRFIPMPDITLVRTSESLPCGYDGIASSVTWQKGDRGTLEASEDLVFLDLRFHPAKRTYYAADRFNITDDYTLTIEDIHLQDEGRYFCTVAGFDIGETTITHTDVTVESTDITPAAKFPTAASTERQSCTPTTECPTDVVFKVTSGVLAAALVFSWCLFLCYVSLRERWQRRNKGTEVNMQPERQLLADTEAKKQPELQA